MLKKFVLVIILMSASVINIFSQCGRVEVTGKVTDEYGRGIKNAQLILAGCLEFSNCTPERPESFKIRATNTFGYYSFVNICAEGSPHLLSVVAKRYQPYFSFVPMFQPIVWNVELVSY